MRVAFQRMRSGRCFVFLFSSSPPLPLIPGFSSQSAPPGADSSRGDAFNLVSESISCLVGHKTLQESGPGEPPLKQPSDSKRQLSSFCLVISNETEAPVTSDLQDSTTQNHILGYATTRS